MRRPRSVLSGVLLNLAVVAVLLTPWLIRPWIFGHTTPNANQTPIIAPPLDDLAAGPEPPRLPEETPVVPITPSPTQAPSIYSLTIVSTALVLGPIQLAAIYSWVHYARASRVILFVDHPTECQASIDKAGLSPYVTIVLTPKPVSSFSGKPKVSVLISEGEKLASTSWMALFNSDIMVNQRFGKLTRIIPPHLAATSLRLDCVVKSEAELEELKLDPLQFDFCNTHGTAAFDFFIWRHGFWNRMLKDRGGTMALDMYIGEAKWDGLLVHLSQPNLTDVTPYHMLLHVAGLHNPAAKGWVPVNQDLMDSHRNNSDGNFPDNVHNAKTVCRMTFQDPNWGRCRMRSTVYEAAFQLCPDLNIRPIIYRQRKMYRDAVSGLNVAFPRSVYRSVADARRVGHLEEAKELEASLDAQFPRNKRLTWLVRSGDCALPLGLLERSR